MQITMPAGLDTWITGHYGEDRWNKDEDWCEECECEIQECEHYTDDDGADRKYDQMKDKRLV